MPGRTVTHHTNPPDNQSQGFHGNYVLSAGSTKFGGTNSSNQLNGMFYVRSNTRMRDLTDGTSNTLMAGEILLNADNGASLDTHGRYYNSYEGNALFSSEHPPNTSVGDRIYGCVANDVIRCSGSGDFVQYLRSRHTGGVQVTLADGGVRFVSENVDTAAFRAAGTRANGKPVTVSEPQPSFPATSPPLGKRSFGSLGPTFLILVAVVTVAGCGGSEAVEKRTVTGTVTFDGEPVDLGDIVFEPASGKGPSAGGSIEKGRYSVDCPLGEMRVRITASRETGKTIDTPIPGETIAETEQYVPACYNDESTLEVVVDSSAAHDFTLTTNCQ